MSPKVGSYTKDVFQRGVLMRVTTTARMLWFTDGEMKHIRIFTFGCSVEPGWQVARFLVRGGWDEPRKKGKTKCARKMFRLKRGGNETVVKFSRGAREDDEGKELREECGSDSDDRGCDGDGSISSVSQRGVGTMRKSLVQKRNEYRSESTRNDQNHSNNLRYAGRAG